MQTQIIKRRDGLFSRSVQIIYDQDRIKTPEQIQQEQQQSIAERRPFGSLLSQVKIVNVQHTGSGAIMIKL